MNIDFNLFEYLEQCTILLNNSIAAAVSTNTTSSNNSSTSTTTNMLPQGSTVTLLFRRARSREYFVAKQGQTLLADPYKYNIRLQGSVSASANYTFELRVVKSPTSSEFVPLGIQIDKQIIVRGAPPNSIDYRVYFSVLSRAYNDASFFVVAKNQSNQVVCTTNQFVLASREKKNYTESTTCN